MSIEWHTEKRKIGDLIPYENNPRQLTEKQYKDLKKSLSKFNLAEIPAINTDSKIIAGHQRLKILSELHGKDYEIDVRVPNRKLTKKEFQEYNVRSNRNLGSWDFDVLANNFELDNLIDWGFDESELDINLWKDEIDEEKLDEIPEPPKEPISKPGDIFLIDGKHRVMCGDSTKKEDVEKLMDGKKADMGFNDPPYGMKKEKDGVLNDNLNFGKLLQFNKEWIETQFAILKDNGSFYCWGTDEPLMDIYSEILKPLIKTQKATFRNLITWDKGSGQGQNAEGFRMYPIADEKCLFVMCGVQGFNNNADNYFEGWEPIRNYLLKQRKIAGWDIPKMKRIAGHSDLSRDHWTGKSQFNMPTKKVYLSFQNYCKRHNIDAFKKEYDELKKEYDELKKEYYSTRAYFDNTHENQNNVWHIDRANSKEREGTGNHATPKPISLCSRAIKSSCKAKGSVVDSFLGSGSTLIAAEQTGRICYGMELDPIYIDVILRRYKNLYPNADIKCLNREFNFEKLWQNT